MGGAATGRALANSGRSSIKRRAGDTRSSDFELRQHDLGALDHGAWQSGELCHLDAVGAVGGARRDLVQEDDVALPFLHPHGGIEQARQLAGERGQLVVMRREQRAATVHLVQVLDRRPGDREPVEGRGAAPDLVEDDERARAGLVEDRGGLDHLDHEGRAAAREIIGCADAREQPIDDADARHSRAGTKLPIWARIAISAFWRRNVDLPAMLGPVTSQMRPAVPSFAERSQSLAMNGRVGEERLLDHRMAAALDTKSCARIDRGRT